VHDFLAGLPEGERVTEAARLIGQPDAAPLPPRFASDPVLAAAYRELLRDGGISRLREFLISELAEQVGAAIRRWAADRLTAIANDLATEEASQRWRADPFTDRLRTVQLCRQQVLRHMQALNDPQQRRKLLDPLGHKCAKQLRDRFDADCLDEEFLDCLSPCQLTEEFRRQAGVLGEELHRLLGLLVVDPLYAALSDSLVKLPAVPIGHEGSVHDVWQRYRKEDLQDRAWRKPRVPGFAAVDLFPPATAPQLEGGLDGHTYRAMMHDKIRVAVQQAAHAVRVQVTARLRDLEAKLAELQGTEAIALPGAAS
jgi:hypothetical protein